MVQVGLDFAAPVSAYTVYRAEVATEQRRLAGSKARILARLRQGPATNVELATICLRYTGRLSDARLHDGAVVTKEHLGGGIWEYTLVSECTALEDDDA